ncbi:MAG: GNAT family N-acetyltransferase, partial [Chloroflexota bacterium]
MGKLLSGGLILRSLTENPQDKERFAEFMHNAFENDGDWRESGFTAWINELLYTHPSMNLEHVWCVVDPANNGKIVSGLFLIPQIWRYEDIEIPVGRPEIVGTLPDYRRRGLVRELFDVLHKYSEQQGDLIQAITGIPYFYRKFGYGVATDLGLRGQIPFTAIPKVNDDETPTYTLRPAEISDIPSFLEFEQSASRHALLTTARDATLWHYELTGRNPKSPWYMHYHTICNQNHDPVGFVGFNNAESAEHSMIVWQWLIGDDANYLETFEDILRAMRDIAKSND